MLDEEGRVSKPGAIVYLDAHYEKVRRGGRVQDVAILKAYRFGTLISEADIGRVSGRSAQAWTCQL